MSTIQYMLLSLVLLIVAVEAKKILRAQEGAATTGKFMVALDLDTPNERFDELVQMVGIQAYDQKIHKVNGHFAKVITAKLSESAIEMIKNEPNVKYIEEETVVSISSIPWHLDRSDQRYLPLDGKFKFDLTGAGVDIYILDTGIRYTHEEFGGRAKYPGYDPVDAETGTNQKGEDCLGHGTHAAGLAGGKTYGMATDATLYSVRILNCRGDGTWSGVIDGINYAASQIKSGSNPGVISIALGGAFSQAANDAVEAAILAKIPVVVAAGNFNDDACSYSPGSVDWAVTVGASDMTDTRSSFSNYGKCIDFFAPGSYIESASIQCDSCTIVYQGTSMASSIVSGLVGALYEVGPAMPGGGVGWFLQIIATYNVLSDIGEGSPNLLLFTYPAYEVGP